jgi:predicted patatin/cPLA2 family phospholipase
MNIVFMGCGWRFPFMFGVAKYIQEHKNKHVNYIKYVGVSAGTAIAYSLQSNNVDLFYKKALSKRTECKYSPLGMCNLIENVAQECATIIPSKNTLFLVATRIKKFGFFETDFLSEFESIDDLCKCMRASSQIPILSGTFTFKHREKYYIDGELSVNIDKIRNIFGKCIVVDFCENADIKPSIQIPRSWSYFPQDDQCMETMYNHGYIKAKEFFSNAAMV